MKLMTARLAYDWHGKKHTLKISLLEFVKMSYINTNSSNGYIEGVLANLSRALSSCALCVLLLMGFSLFLCSSVCTFFSDCHGGPCKWYHYLHNNSSYISSYMISFLSSYMILLGIHWKLWVVWVVVFVCGICYWCNGLVVVGRAAVTYIVEVFSVVKAKRLASLVHFNTDRPLGFCLNLSMRTMAPIKRGPWKGIGHGRWWFGARLRQKRLFWYVFVANALVTWRL